MVPQFSLSSSRKQRLRFVQGRNALSPVCAVGRVDLDATANGQRPYASFPIAELDEALGRVRQYLTIAMLQAELMRERGELPDAETSACVHKELAEFLAPSQFHNDAINSSEGLLKNDLKDVLDKARIGARIGLQCSREGSARNAAAGPILGSAGRGACK
eukprot:2316126-Amphidinium_carterae.1